MARRRPAPFLPARRWLQLMFLGGVVVIGVEFGLWAGALLRGSSPPIGRPPGVEGFLPISALMSLRLWLAGGGVHPVHPAALAVLVAVLVASFAVPRSFCSHVCPVGTVSEGLGRLGARLLGSTWTLPRLLDVPLRGVRYLLLAFFAWAVFFAADLPGIRAFLDSPYNRVADVKLLLFFSHPSRAVVAVLGVLVVGSVLVRDLWCRYLCPYGALLGLLGRLAPLKVSRDATSCTDCRACTRACPARLEVHRATRVASVECTACQDCVAACPVAGCLAVRVARRARPLAPVRVALGAVVVFLLVILAFRATGRWRGSVSEVEYARRIQEIGSPLYTHVGGMAPRETRSHAVP